MALAPRSSLRSLVLLMSHGKPRLSSFFSSSSSTATGVLPAGPGADTPPAAVQPPAPPGASCPKLPVEEEFVLHPIPGGPRPRPRPRPRGAVKDVLTGKACLNANEDPGSAYSNPEHGPSSTPEPDKPPCGASEDVKQRDVDPPPPAREGVGHRVVDPPRGGRGRRAVPDEPEQCTQEDPKCPVPDSSGDEVFSSCSSAAPPPAPGTCTPAGPDVQPPGTPALPGRSSHKLPDHEESVVHPIPDPRGNRINPVIKEPAQCTLDNPKYPTPDHGLSSPSERPSEGLLEDPRHPVRDPPRRP